MTEEREHGKQDEYDDSKQRWFQIRERLQDDQDIWLLSVQGTEFVREPSDSNGVQAEKRLNVSVSGRK